MQSFWHCVPFVRLLLPFLAGVATNMALFLNGFYWLLACLFSLLVFFIISFFGKKYINYWAGFWLIAVCFLLGGLLHAKCQQRIYSSHFSNQAASFLIVEIAEQPKLKTKSVKMVAKVLAVTDSLNNQQPATGNLLVYVERNLVTEQLNYGQLLIIPARYNEVYTPQNPNEFNYKKYLSFNQIYHQCFVGSRQLVVTERVGGYAHYKLAYRLQDYIKNRLQTYVQSHREIAVAQALLFGYDDDIDPDLAKAYGNTGTLHVLAVSGMHVGLIYLIITFVLSPLLKLKRLKWLVHVLSFLLIWSYAVLCGLSPSVLRASVMISFFILAELIDRKGNSYNTLAASAMLLLLINPNMAASVGFQLSYLAVLGIIGVNPFLYRMLLFKSWLGNQIWQITCVSISAQLATFPLGLLYFHQFPLCFPISNLLIIPLVSFIIYAAIVLMVLGFIHPLAIAAGYVVKTLLAFTNTTVSWLEYLPYAYLNGFSISVLETGMLYFSIFCVVMYFIKPFKWLLAFSMAVFVCFSASRLVKTMQNQQQHDLTIYHIKQHTAMRLINGNKSILIADSALLADKDKMVFHLQQQAWHRQISTTDTLNMPKAGCFTFNQTQVFVNALPKDSLLNNINSVLLITDKQFAKQFAKQPYAFSEVIINNSFSSYFQQLAAHAASQNNINYKVLAKSGFVTFKID